MLNKGTQAIFVSTFDTTFHPFDYAIVSTCFDLAIFSKYKHNARMGHDALYIEYWALNEILDGHYQHYAPMLYRCPGPLQNSLRGDKR